MTEFPLQIPGYFIKRLSKQDANILQPLYEQCKDFFILTDGLEPSPTAASEEFFDFPEGKTPEDVYIFGLFDKNQKLLGMIAGVEYYPNTQTWWIGLMMLTPEYRGKGLGTKFYKAFENWVATKGITQISLVVIKPNKLGLQFWQRMGFEVIRKTSPRQYKAKSHEVYVLSRAIDKVS